MRVDQRDHEAEGLREVGALQPALGLLRVELVPSLAERPRVARRRSARPSRSRRRPAAPSRRTRSRVAGAPRPMAPSRRAVTPCPRVGQVPLALVGDLVAAPGGASGRDWASRAEARARFPTSARAGGAPGRIRAAPAGAAPRGAQDVDRVAATAGRLRGSGRRSACVCVSVTPCWAGYRPVRSVARLGEHIDVLQNALGKTRPLSAQPVVVWHQIAKPTRVVGPMARVALLVGDQQQDVGGSPGSAVERGVVHEPATLTSSATPARHSASRAGRIGVPETGHK